MISRNDKRLSFVKFVFELSTVLIIKKQTNISEDVTFLEFKRLTVLQYKSCTLYGIDETYPQYPIKGHFSNYFKLPKIIFTK